MSEFDHNEVEVPEGLLEINNDRSANPKLHMFLEELSNVKETKTLLESKIITTYLESFQDHPQESYPKCFKNQYYKAGGTGFSRGYEKRC